MRKHFFITFLLVYVLSACFTKRKTELVQFSTAEFPYIESFHEGVSLKLRGQYNEAITSFEKCLQWKSDQDAVYYALSELYLLKNEPQRSAEYIQKAALLDPNNKWYIQELAFMYFEQGKYSVPFFGVTPNFPVIFFGQAFQAQGADAAGSIVFEFHGDDLPF